MVLWIYLIRCLLNILTIRMTSLVIVRRRRSLSTTSLVWKICRLVLVQMVRFYPRSFWTLLSAAQCLDWYFLRLNQFFIFICILLLEILLSLLWYFLSIILYRINLRVWASICCKVLLALIKFISILNRFLVLLVDFFLIQLLFPKIWLLHLSMIEIFR